MIYMTKPSMALVGRQAKEGQRNHRPRMAKDIIDLGRTKSKPTQGSSVGTGAVRKVVLCHAKAQNRRQCHSYMPMLSPVRRVDTRQTYAVVPGQEVLTSEAVPIKLTIAASYLVSDPDVAVNETE